MDRAGDRWHPASWFPTRDESRSERIRATLRPETTAHLRANARENAERRETNRQRKDSEVRFMNAWEIEDALERYAGHPILGPATVTLHNLMFWTNCNSDGWAYWPKPARAAARLMELITPDGSGRFYTDDQRRDITEAEYLKALIPIKAFKTRHKADFTIRHPQPKDT
jgi:hypothetical protein